MNNVPSVQSSCWCAVLSLLVICGCTSSKSRCDTIWGGDIQSSGVILICDGVAIDTLLASTFSEARLYPHEEVTCYSLGDTVAIAGGASVGTVIRLPLGEHEIELVGPDGSRLSFRTTIGDSDQFWIYWKCPAVFYPDGSGGHGLARLP